MYRTSYLQKTRGEKIKGCFKAKRWSETCDQRVELRVESRRVKLGPSTDTKEKKRVSSTAFAGAKSEGDKPGMRTVYSIMPVVKHSRTPSLKVGDDSNNNTTMAVQTQQNIIGVDVNALEHYVFARKY